MAVHLRQQRPMDQPIDDRGSVDDRRPSPDEHRPVIVGVPVRDEDIETTRGVHSVAMLFRVLAALIGVIVVLQILNGVTSTVEISYGVLIAEVIRLVIFAGLLWGAGDLADLYVTSHHDIRAMRILLSRMAHRDETPPRFREPGADEPGPGAGRGDATH